MRYSEFEQLVKDEGFDTNETGESLFVLSNQKNIVTSVGKTKMFMLDTNWYYFQYLSDYDKERLLKLAIELARTPLDEREDEKRYRLRLPFIKSYGYLNLDEINGVYELSGEKQVNNYQTIFAESEVEELKQNYNLDSFVMEEVKEDE